MYNTVRIEGFADAFQIFPPIHGSILLPPTQNRFTIRGNPALVVMSAAKCDDSTAQHQA